MEKKKEVSIINPMPVMGLTLIPVVESSLGYGYGKSGISFFGIKQPIAVVVVTPSAKKVIRTTGEEVSLGQFIQEMPEAKEILESI